MVTLEVRFVPTKDNYIKMPPQKFALPLPILSSRRRFVSEKVSSFPFSLLLSAFTIFLRTFQIIFFAYLTREWFFLLFTYEILRGKIGERPAKVVPLAHALCLTTELL